MELLLLLGLILLNGVFSLSEMAVVSARKTRLQHLADQGDQTAEQALQLAQQPNRLLSTVQIGITLIGILAGAVGGATLADQLLPLIQQIPSLAPYSEELAFGSVVLLTTYLSLVIGELIPKRIALINPERTAMLIARPMSWLSRLTTPLVWFLSKSTDLGVRILGIRGSEEPPVTEGEIVALMQEGSQYGVFEEDESQMVKGVLRLDDIRVGGIITPRTELVWLDQADDTETIKTKIMENPHSVYPVVDNDMDHVLGIVKLKDMLLQLVEKREINLESIMYKALTLPESVPTAEVLRRFKQTGIHTAFIVGEYGGIEGVVTMHDVVEEIVGEIDGHPSVDIDREAVRRTDGSWLLDGLLSLYRVEEIYPSFSIPEDEHGSYDTLAGFVLARLGHIPEPAEHFQWNDLIFEVMDMDEMRIDKVLVRSTDETEEIS